MLKAAPATDPSKRGNSECAKWCHANFLDAAAGHCTAEAAKSKGPCYECGPLGNNLGVCDGACCTDTPGRKMLKAAPATNPSKRGNSECAKWCHANFLDAAAGHCTAEAAKSQGPCYECGPLGSNLGVCEGACCADTPGRKMLVAAFV